jgi:hypothetical protein
MRPLKFLGIYFLAIASVKLVLLIVEAIRNRGKSNDK